MLANDTERVDIAPMTTLTASLNASLWPIATACIVTLLGGLVYRVTHILMSMLVDALFFAGRQRMMDRTNGSQLQRFARLGVVGFAFQFLALIVTSTIRLVAFGVRTVLVVAYMLLPLVVLSCLLAVLQQNWSAGMALLTDAFGSQSALSSTLKAAVLLPLTILDGLGAYVLPIYNLVVFVFVQSPLQVLLWLFRGAGASHFLSALGELRAAAPALALSVGRFVQNNGVAPCPRTYCSAVSSSSPACLRMGRSVLAQACLDPSRRELDLMPAFIHTQQAVAHTVLGLGGSCTAVALFMNMTLFPLTDPSLWFALDRGINSVLALTVGAGTATTQRCELAGGFTARPAMCFPDFGHGWAVGAQAARAFGDALTHWVDALYLQLFNSKSIEAACMEGRNYPGIWSDPRVRTLFGSNATALVRLAADVFALTDGVGVVYVQVSSAPSCFLILTTFTAENRFLTTFTPGLF